MELAAKRNLDGLMTAGICLLAAASLPVVAALAFFMRPVILTAIFVVMIGWALCCLFCPALRDAPADGAEVRPEHRGVQLPPDVMLDPSHEWVRAENGEVVVGIDDLAQSALGPLDDAQLPPDGLAVHRGDPLFRLRRGDRKIDFRAPLSGTVVSGNDDVRRRPRLVNEEPYGRGWLVRLRDESGAAGWRSLLRGPAAKDWLEHEADRVGAVLWSRGTVAQPAGADLPLDRLYRQIDDDAWCQLTQTVIAVPTEADAPESDPHAPGAIGDEGATHRHAE